VVQYIKKNGSITSMEAFHAFGITRLAARIYEMKKIGYVIVRSFERNSETSVHFARYSFSRKKKYCSHHVG